VEPSEPEKPGLVRDVVGSTFAKHVTGEDAPEHVLIQLYSPYSSTCRVLAPYYHNLSVALASHSDPVMQRISIAVIDVDQNDTPPP
jgi:thioredoxin-like negative regulator of GroEL